MLVAQKLRVQPECQSHREELVNTAQQVLLDTTKVRLMPELAGGLAWAESSWLGGLDGARCSHSGHRPRRETCPRSCQGHRHRVHYQLNECQVWKPP